MFNRRRVRFVHDAAFDLLTPDERRAVQEGEVTRTWGDAFYTAIYDTEDRAVRVARFLMNKNIQYVQRG